jgi:transcriptional regulator with XRE-family HTH domain
MEKRATAISEFRRQAGPLVRKAQEAAGITVKELAERSGTSARLIRRASGASQARVSFESFEKLAGALPDSDLARMVQQQNLSRMADAAEDPSEFRSLFGVFLKRSRLRAGLGVRELARRTEINASYLSKLESTHIPPPKPRKLAALVRELPGTEFAELINRIASDKLREESLHLTAKLLEVLGALRSRTAAHDLALRSELQMRLQTCLKIIEIT